MENLAPRKKEDTIKPSMFVKSAETFDLTAIGEETAYFCIASTRQNSSYGCLVAQFSICGPSGSKLIIDPLLLLGKRSIKHQTSRKSA